MEQVRFVMASARIPTSRIRMPDGIEHFVEVVAVLLNVTFSFRKGKGVECREVYPRCGLPRFRCTELPDVGKNTADS